MWNIIWKYQLSVFTSDLSHIKAKKNKTPPHVCVTSSWKSSLKKVHSGLLRKRVDSESTLLHEMNQTWHDSHFAMFFFSVAAKLEIWYTKCFKQVIYASSFSALVWLFAVCLSFLVSAFLYLSMFSGLGWRQQFYVHLGEHRTFD